MASSSATTNNDSNVECTPRMNPLQDAEGKQSLASVPFGRGVQANGGEDNDNDDPLHIVHGSHHISTSNESAVAAVRRAIEEELKKCDGEDDATTGSAALRVIMRRGMSRMPVVVGIGPDGRPTTTSEAIPITPTTATTAATSSQDQPQPSHYHFRQDSGTATPPS